MLKRTWRAKVKYVLSNFKSSFDQSFGALFMEIITKYNWNNQIILGKNIYIYIYTDSFFLKCTIFNCLLFSKILNFLKLIEHFLEFCPKHYFIHQSFWRYNFTTDLNLENPQSKYLICYYQQQQLAMGNNFFPIFH